MNHFNGQSSKVFRTSLTLTPTSSTSKKKYAQPQFKVLRSRSRRPQVTASRWSSGLFYDLEDEPVFDPSHYHILHLYDSFGVWVWRGESFHFFFFAGRPLRRNKKFVHISERLHRTTPNDEFYFYATPIASLTIFGIMPYSLLMHPKFGSKKIPTRKCREMKLRCKTFCVMRGNNSFGPSHLFFLIFRLKS